MAKHYSIEKKEGYQSIVTPEDSDLQLLNFSIIQSGQLEKYSGILKDCEAAFVITKGLLEFFVNGKSIGKLQRKNVFDEPPFAVYAPPSTKYTMKFQEESEVCIISCRTETKYEARLIEPKDLKFKRVGEETYCRNITNIMPETFSAGKIVLGETINDDGNWSSYPPHKHDEDNLPEEVKMEEIYFFKIHPETGFGMIRVFDDKDNNLFLLKNNEVVTIPKGYHPVTVAPKHQIYYLWALAGEKRILMPNTHPDFRF